MLDHRGGWPCCPWGESGAVVQMLLVHLDLDIFFSPSSDGGDHADDHADRNDRADRAFWPDLGRFLPHLHLKVSETGNPSRFDRVQNNYHGSAPRWGRPRPPPPHLLGWCQQVKPPSLPTMITLLLQDLFSNWLWLWLPDDQLFPGISPPLACPEVYGRF